MTNKREQEAGHTPVPWAVIKPKKAGGALGDFGDRGIVAGNVSIGEMWEHCPAKFNPDGVVVDAAANAAFIVRAVNSFEGLVEALKDARAELDVSRAEQEELSQPWIALGEAIDKIDAALLTATDTRTGE